MKTEKKGKSSLQRTKDRNGEQKERKKMENLHKKGLEKGMNKQRNENKMMESLQDED